MSERYYRFEVTWIDKNGNERKRTVEARHEFEAVQIAGALNEVVLSIVNLDR